MRKYQIVHVLKNLGIGGTEKTAQIFARELATTYKDIYDTFVLYNAKGDLSRFKLFETSVGSERMIPYMYESSGTEILDSLKPDIVHVYRSGLPEWPRRPKKSLFVETNVFGHLDHNNLPDKSLFMSNWLLQQAKRVYGDSPTFDFINNPTDAPKIDTALNRSLLFKNYNLPSNTLILGRCGRPDDGIYDDIAMKAILLLQTKYPLFFLVVAPPPLMLKQLHQYGIAHFVIHPTVNETQLNVFYNTVDIYCHSRADGETYGNNIAEAMSHGKPVITHRAVPSHPGMGVFQAQCELVEDAKTGFVCPHSVREYADALEALILNPHMIEDMGRAGKEKFDKELSATISCAKLHNIYQNLINSHCYELRN